MPTSPRPNRRALAAALVAGLAVAVFATGCGSVGYTESTGDRASGKALFTQKCGSCHTLADAGTTGMIGPNLDDAFAESRRNGLGESTFVQVVRDQIAYPIENTSTGAPGHAARPRHGSGCRRRRELRGERRGDRRQAGSGAQADPDHLRLPPEAALPGDAAAGKVVFTTTASCGGCHTLADAGSTGTIGPNLDEREAERRPRDDAGDEGQGRHALVQGSARRDPDRRRRRVRLERRRQVAARRRRADPLLRLSVGAVADDVGDGHVEAVTRRLDDPPLEPVRRRRARVSRSRSRPREIPAARPREPAADHRRRSRRAH